MKVAFALMLLALAACVSAAPQLASVKQEARRSQTEDSVRRMQDEFNQLTNDAN